MKVLVIGAGSIGKRHAINFKNLNHEVVVCDPDESRVKQFSKENNFKYYFDYSEVLIVKILMQVLLQP